MIEYVLGILQGKSVDEDKVEFIKEKQFFDDDFWCLNFLIGVEFVMIKIYWKFKKEEFKWFKVREVVMWKIFFMVLGSYGLFW